MTPFIAAFWLAVAVAVLICASAAWIVAHRKEWM
jgi:hypothetical protein